MRPTSLALLGLALLGVTATANAGTKEDCGQDKDIDLKLTACTAMIQRQPRNAGHYIDRGNGYFLKGDFGKAVSDYTKAIELVPSDNIAYHNRCAAYNNLDRPDDAIADCTRALTLKANDHVAFNNRCHSHIIKKQFDRAAGDCRRSLAIERNYGKSWTNLCYALTKLGDFDGIIDMCGKGIAVLPADGWLYYRRGRAHLRKGNLAQARADADKANVLEKQQIEILVLRGEVQEAEGNHQGAVSDYRAALKLAPSDDDDRDAQRNALERITRLEK